MIATTATILEIAFTLPFNRFLEINTGSCEQAGQSLFNGIATAEKSAAGNKAIS